MDKKLWDACLTESDINEHLPTLALLASGLDVVEFGVRSGESTLAFLAGGAKSLTSYDISPATVRLDSVPDNWRFIQEDVLRVEIPECDLLFLDTLHVYGQVKRELELHASKVRRWIAFHDTETFGVVGRQADRAEFAAHGWGKNYQRAPDGILFAIQEFIEGNPEWKIKARWRNNNGMMLIERDGLCRMPA